MLKLSLEHLAFLQAQIDAIDSEVLQLIEREGYQSQFELLHSVPGILQISAAALLAEIGGDMNVFPSAAHLSSWIGVCPGNRISAGKNRNPAITRGTDGRGALWWSVWGPLPRKRIATFKNAFASCA